MSTEPEFFKPPRKKPSIFWWLGAAFLVLVLLFLFQLLGPSPPIKPARQTTYITEPLQPNGMPDYERYILERMRDGVTPQNNAATLIWPTLWPGELQLADYEIVAAELGLTGVPSQRDALVPITKYLQSSARQQSVEDAETPVASADAQAVDDVPQMVDQDSEDKLKGRILHRPWTTAEFPLVARWIDQNKKPLDRLVEASRRPRCYFPSTTLLNQKSDMLFTILLPGEQGSREIGRSLLARTMWNIGEHRPNDAWSDLLAVYRTGPLVAQGETLVAELIGIALTGMAFEGTITLLSDTLPADVSRQMLHDLNGLESYGRAADLIDRSERFYVADCVIAISRGELDPKLFDPSGKSGDELNFLHRVNIDWNAVLRKGNEYYDNQVAAMRMKDPAARQAALDRVENDLEAAVGRSDAGSYFAAVVNPSARSETVASHLMGLLLPALSLIDETETRANVQLELARIGAALALFHAEHGAYPAKLEVLVPALFENLPPDPSGNKTFYYQRTADGYLLYSFGSNLVDDHGSNERHDIFEGIRIEALEEGAGSLRDKVPNGADDISIRIPRVPSKSSTPPAGSETPTPER
jgi:hypothetical protein